VETQQQALVVGQLVKASSKVCQKVRIFNEMTFKSEEDRNSAPKEWNILLNLLISCNLQSSNSLLRSLRGVMVLLGRSQRPCHLAEVSLFLSKKCHRQSSSPTKRNDNLFPWFLLSCGKEAVETKQQPGQFLL
jgi:hypothetical protein